MLCIIFLWLFLAVCLVFSFIIMCLGMDSFELILFRTCWVIQVCIFRPFNKCGEFSAIRIFFSASHSSSSPSLTPLTNARCSGIVPQVPEALFIYFYLFTVCHSDWIIFNDLSSRSLTPVSFLFWLLYFSVLKFSVSLFYILSFFAETFYLPILN